MSEVVPDMDIWRYSERMVGRMLALPVRALALAYPIQERRSDPVLPFYAQLFADILEEENKPVHDEFRILREIGALAYLDKEYSAERPLGRKGPPPRWHVRTNPEFWEAEQPAIKYALKTYGGSEWLKIKPVRFRVHRAV